MVGQAGRRLWWRSIDGSSANQAETCDERCAALDNVVSLARSPHNSLYTHPQYSCCADRATLLCTGLDDEIDTCNQPRDVTKTTGAQAGTQIWDLLIGRRQPAATLGAMGHAPNEEGALVGGCGPKGGGGEQDVNTTLTCTKSAAPRHSIKSSWHRVDAQIKRLAYIDGVKHLCSQIPVRVRVPIWPPCHLLLLAIPVAGVLVAYRGLLRRVPDRRCVLQGLGGGRRRRPGL